MFWNRSVTLKEGYVTEKSFLDLYERVKHLEDRINVLEANRSVQKEANRPKRPYKRHRWLTTHQGAKLLKIPKTTFIRWVNRGYVPHKAIGKAFLYREEDLLALNIQEIREKNLIERDLGHANATVEMKRKVYEHRKSK